MEINSGISERDCRSLFNFFSCELLSIFLEYIIIPPICLSSIKAFVFDDTVVPSMPSRNNCPTFSSIESVCSSLYSSVSCGDISVYEFFTSEIFGLYVSLGEVVRKISNRKGIISICMYFLMGYYITQGQNKKKNVSKTIVGIFLYYRVLR